LVQDAQAFSPRLFLSHVGSTSLQH